jgi:hypothetical protein
MFCTNCGKDNPDTNKFCLQCGQPLVGNAAGVEHPAPSPDHPGAQVNRRSGRIPLIIGGMLLLIILAAGAYFLLPRLTGGGSSGREMLLAAPNRRGEADLFVLRLGDDLKEKAVIVAEDITPAGTDSVSFANLIALNESTNRIGTQNIGGTYGGFLPGTERLVTFFSDDGKTRMLEYVVGAEEPIEIISANNGWFRSVILPDSRNLFILEALDSGSWRCHIAANGEGATRVVRRADYCDTTGDGTRFLTQQISSNGEMTLTVTDLDGGNEVTLLDKIEAISFRISSDASHVAYLSSTTDGQSVFLFDDSGNELLESDEFVEISDYGFAGTSDTLYYIGANEDGERELYTSIRNEPLVESPALSVIPAFDGSTLAVLTADEDGVGEVSVFNLVTGEVLRVFSGDFLSMATTPTTSPRLLVREVIDDELVLTAAEMSGANPVTLFDDDGYMLNSIRISQGDDRLFLLLNDEDSQISLFVAPLDGSGGFFVVEGWHEIQLRNLSGDTLLLVGREDVRDDTILYAVKLEPGAKPIELDDTADAYGYAVVSPDRKMVFYNAVVGDRPDDVVVRQVQLDGEESPEDLYSKMLLVAVRWDEIEPINNTVFWRDAGPVAQSLLGGTTPIINNFHRGAITSNSLLTLFGDSFYGDILSFRGRAGQFVRIDVLGANSIASSNLDPVATLLDADVNQLDWDDDGGSGTNAQITYTLPKDGTYYLLVTSPGGSRFGEGDRMAYEVFLSFD